MKNSNKNKDHSKFHRWINYPNKSNRKCTICGCLYHATHSNATGKNTITYTKNDIESTTFIDCVKPNYDDIDNSFNPQDHILPDF